MTQAPARQRRTLLLQLFFFMIVLPWVLALYLLFTGANRVLAFIVLAMATSDIALFLYIMNKLQRDAGDRDDLDEPNDQPS